MEGLAQDPENVGATEGAQALGYETLTHDRRPHDAGPHDLPDDLGSHELGSNELCFHHLRLDLWLVPTRRDRR